jgi:hypothetical protein
VAPAPNSARTNASMPESEMDFRQSTYIESSIDVEPRVQTRVTWDSD